MGYKTFQILIWVGLVVANIHFQWGVNGLAISVMGGMAAWYFTGLLAAGVDRARLGSVPVSRGQLDDFLEAAAEAKRQRHLRDR